MVAFVVLAITLFATQFGQSNFNQKFLYGALIGTSIVFTLAYSFLFNRIACVVWFDEKTDKIVISANTTMLYSFFNLDLTPLSRSPFIISEFFGKDIDNIYVPPVISAFVGADITSGILASGMTEKNESI